MNAPRRISFGMHPTPKPKKVRIPRVPSALEERFWFLCMAERGMERPEREYQFHPTRKWRFDFAWPAHKVAVECEGGTWTGGRHTRGTGFAADCEKYSTAAALGWRIIRVTKPQIDSGAALAWAILALSV